MDDRDRRGRCGRRGEDRAHRDRPRVFGNHGLPAVCPPEVRQGIQQLWDGAGLETPQLPEVPELGSQTDVQRTEPASPTTTQTNPRGQPTDTTQPQQTLPTRPQPPPEQTPPEVEDTAPPQTLPPERPTSRPRTEAPPPPQTPNEPPKVFNPQRPALVPLHESPAAPPEIRRISPEQEPVLAPQLSNFTINAGE